MIGTVIFHIVRIVRKRKFPPGDADEEPEKSSVWHKIIDFLNAALFIAIIVFLIGAALSYGIEEVKKYAYRRELSKNEEYRTSVLTELVASERYKNAGLNTSDENVSADSGDDAGDMNSQFEKAEYEICWEAYTYAMYVELLAKDASLKFDDAGNVGFSTITSEVLECGRDDYITFTKRYIPERGVEMLNQDIVYNEKEENVSVSSELYCVNEEENCTVNAWVVVVFDKNWQVCDIHCQKEELVQYVPY